MNSSIELRKLEIKDDIFTHRLYFGQGAEDFLNAYLSNEWFIVDGNVDKGKVVFLFESKAIPDKVDIDIENKNSEIKPFSLTSIRRNGNNIEFDYFVSADDLIEDYSNNWAPLQFYNTIIEETTNDDRFSIETFIEKNAVFNSSISINLKLPIEGTIDFLNNESIKILSELKNRINSNRQFKWDKDYLVNEKLFSLQVINPLLRKMHFNSIRFSHGRKEYGKDFTFSELDKFGQVKYYGIQVKVGNVSGQVNSPIDELIGQIEDAFSMPYFDLDSKNPLYISTLIIIISGYFTENAKEKIMNKINKGLHGSVYFIDQDKILELVEKYWNN